MHKRILVTLLMLSSVGLSSCATARVVCLPMKEYTPEQQAGLAGEVSRTTPALRGLIQDYFQMREANRACKGAR